MTVHEIPLERRTLHGHFSRDLEPVLTIDPGDTIAFSCLDAGWHTSPGRKFEPRDEHLDAGHALIGPVEVRGAGAGQTLEVSIGRVAVGSWGWCGAGDWPSPLNDRLRLGLTAGPGLLLEWTLEEGIGRDEGGRELDLHPFLGVLGMPPPDKGVHSTTPPRIWGGNIDCKELVEGAKLFLPIPVDGALFSGGDCQARQGDGEVSQLAIECPLERAELTLELRDDLALASLVVDLRVTQLVNDVLGVHAVLPHDALRFPRMA